MRRKIMAALVVAVLISVGVWFWRTRRDPLPGGMSPTRFVQLPHDVNVLKFVAAEGLLMASDATEDGTVTFVDAQSGRIVRSWKGGGGSIWISEGGQNTLIMSYDLQAKNYHYVLHDALTGAVLRQWTDKGRAEAVARDLSVMIVIEGGKIKPYRGRVSEISSGRERGRFEVPEVAWRGVSLSRDAHYLSVTGGKDIPATLLSMDDLRPVLKLPPLRNVVVSQDEKRVIGIDAQGTIHFWQLPSKQHSTVVTGLDRTNWIYEIFDGRLVLDGGRDNPPLDSSNPKVLSYSSVLQVRSENGTEVLREFSANATKTFASGGRFIGFEAPRPQNSAASHSNVYEVYDISHLSNSQRPLRIDARRDVLGQQSINDSFTSGQLSISSDGRRVAYATRAGLVRIYDVEQGGSGYRSDLVTTLGGRNVVSFTGNLRDALVLPAGGVAALGSNGDYEDKSFVQVVQLKSGARTYADKEVAAAITEFGLSAQGRNLNNFYFDFNQQQQTYQGATFLLASKTVSPDENTVLMLWNRATKSKGKDNSWSVGGRGLIELRATKDDRVLHRLEIVRSNNYGMHGALGSPTWSRDSKLVALADQLGVIYLWDATTGQRAGQLSGARAKTDGVSSAFVDSGFGQISPLAFSPVNRHLVAGRDDGALLVYSLQTLLPVAQMGQAGGALRWLQFAPDGLTLYGVVVNGKSVLAWPVPNPLP